VGADDSLTTLAAQVPLLGLSKGVATAAGAVWVFTTPITAYVHVISWLLITPGASGGVDVADADCGVVTWPPIAFGALAGCRMHVDPFADNAVLCQSSGSLMARLMQHMRPPGQSEQILPLPSISSGVSPSSSVSHCGYVTFSPFADKVALCFMSAMAQEPGFSRLR
jgi:hypothetical protein